MRNAYMGTAAALIVALSGCGDSDTGSENRVEVPGPEAVENQLESMPEGQRNGVFIRAIRDAGQDCQHVESSERAGEHRGYPVWNATCAGGGTWTIVITDNGIAQVLNAAEAQLVSDANQAVRQHEGQ